MRAQPSPLFARERIAILAVLLTLAAAAWGLLAWQSRTMDREMAMTPTMGMGAPLFFLIWVVMMVAMMFPTAAPMILAFARVSANNRKQGRAFVPAWVFVGAYLLVWAGFGVLAFALGAGAERVAERSGWVMAHAASIGGALIVLAGVYQVTPLKDACLARCRTPLSYVLTSWREGYGGALVMGLEHGVYCLGCCWMLFLLLFPLGMLNIVAMALLTALIFAEKAFPLGRQVSRVAAAALIAYGALVLLVPSALPGM